MAKDAPEIIRFSMPYMGGTGTIDIRYPDGVYSYTIPSSEAYLFEMNKLYNTPKKRQKNVGKLVLLLKKAKWYYKKIGSKIDIAEEINNISELLK